MANKIKKDWFKR